MKYFAQGTKRCNRDAYGRRCGTAFHADHAYLPGKRNRNSGVKDHLSDLLVVVVAAVGAVMFTMNKRRLKNGYVPPMDDEDEE